MAPRPALVIRPWELDDEPALSSAIVGSLGHLRPWMPWVAREPLAPGARRAQIRAWRRDALAGGDEIFGLFGPDGQTVLGSGGLHRRVGPGGLEIGYWVGASHLRRGIASEAVRFLVEEAFTRPSIDRVEIHHDVANVASGRIPARLGFALVAEIGDERVWRLRRRA